MGALVKLQRGQAVLSVDDEESFLRLLQPADAAGAFPRFKTQFLRCEQQDRPRDWRLGDGSFVKVTDGADLRTGKLALWLMLIC